MSVCHCVVDHSLSNFQIMIDLNYTRINNDNDSLFIYYNEELEALGWFKLISTHVPDLSNIRSHYQVSYCSIE